MGFERDSLIGNVEKEELAVNSTEEEIILKVEKKLLNKNCEIQIKRADQKNGSKRNYLKCTKSEATTPK